MSHEEVGQFLISMVGKKKAEWWFRVYLTGLDREAGAALELEVVLIRAGFLADGETFDRNQYLGQFAQGWGWHDGSRLTDIFRRIETVDKF